MKVVWKGEIHGHTHGHSLAPARTGQLLEMALQQQRAFSASAQAKRGVVVRVAPARMQVYARESRIGSKPITVPKGVTVTISGQTLKVKVRLVTQASTAATQGYGGSILNDRTCTAVRRAPRASWSGPSCLPSRWRR